MNNPLKPNRLPASKTALLRRVPPLSGCSDRELAEIARLVDEADVQAGDVLTEEGAAGREAFLIIDGWAAVLVDGEPMAALGPGQLVGEIAMLDRGPRTATVVAKTPMRLLVIGPEAFADFAEQPTIARHMSKTMAARLRHAGAAEQRSSEAGATPSDAEKPSH